MKLLLICSIFLVLSCRQGGGTHATDARRESASQAAEQYYKCLIDSQYDKFVAGMMPRPAQPSGKGSASTPHDYRRQLLLAVQQWASNEQRVNGGITSARATGETIHPDSRHATVSMELVFGNGRTERTELALVLHDGEWKMK